MHRLSFYLLIAFVTPALLSGCGPSMGQVHGKLMYQGKPVTAGSISFAPKVPEGQFEAGRPAAGAPDENGDFQLSTNAKNDGAMVGPHVVIYLSPGPAQATDPELFAKLKANHEKFGNLRLPPGHTIEVKPGRQDITIELERAP